MIELTELCSCACGALLLTRRERQDQLCTACADAPACCEVIAEPTADPNA